MKRNISILICLCCLLAISSARGFGQPKATDYSSISKAEIEMLLADVGKTNPKVLQRLAEDPEMKKKQIEDLRQLLAFASQAQRDGLASGPINKQELENIYAEILAVNYDREINKDKGPMPAFGFITDDQVKAYWAEKETAGQRTHEAEFNDFLNAKIAILRTSSPDMKDREISDDEKEQSRDIFAKTRIYRAEYESKLKAGELSRAFIDKANLQVKLQQAQFLSRLYSEKIIERTTATEADIAKYIAAHPELDTAKKKAKAQGILDRVKAGGNFAVLANQFSDDPGNEGPGGKGNGGLYKDVPQGRMVVPFETAALALRPGQISAELVETDFGFHIIKLERKLAAKVKGGEDETYDVRHILISTGVKNPDDPAARETPVKEFVRNKLEKDNEKRLTAEIIAANNIQVPDDFTVPVVVAERPKTVDKEPVTPKRPVKKRP